MVRLILILTSALLATSCVSNETTPDTHPGLPAGRPNIVLIVADDLGIGDLGCYNAESKVATASLDQLAREGMRFTDAHSPSAVCTPTRYATLTGRYSWRSRLTRGVLQGYNRLLIEPEQPTIASFLKKHGYSTGCIGKWHLGLGSYDADQPRARTNYDEPFDAGPHTVGFDRVCIIPASLDMPPYVWIVGDRPEQLPTASTPGSQRRWAGGGGFWRKGAMSPDFDFEGVLPRIGDESVEFIADASSREAPFFLYVPLAAPHTPWVPTEQYQGATEAGWYGDFVHQVDATIGKILAAIDRAGVRESTIVIVTSDNGSHWPARQIEQYGHRANLNFRGQKADIHEGGHRVPFIARWPERVRAGSVAPATIGLHDIYATVIELLGEQPSPNEASDSASFCAVLEDPSTTLDHSLVHHSLSGVFAIRRDRWKLIAALGSGGFTEPKRVIPEEGGPTGQLYDLESDPEEQHNLWLDEPDVVTALLAELDTIRSHAGSNRPSEQ